MTAVAVTTDTAALPQGKTCKDCHAFEYCNWLLQAKADSTECDWTPSRFRLRNGRDYT
jgi:hypothetical protein